MFSIMKERHKKFNSLNKLKTRAKDNKKRKEEVLTNVGDIYNELYDIYKNKYNIKVNSLSAKDKKKLNYKQLRLSDNYLYSSEEEQKEQDEKQDEKSFGLDDLIELIINREELPINNELFKKHFQLESPILMHKILYDTKDKEKKSKLLNIFNSGLKDLEKEIKEMSKEEIENEKPYILDFNRIKQQEGQGIKIVTPNQMLNRLPIALALLKAGNNSNEIMQPLYSLYRSNNITEEVYKSLIGII